MPILLKSIKKGVKNYTSFYLFFFKDKEKLYSIFGKGNVAFLSWPMAMYGYIKTTQKSLVFGDNFAQKHLKGVKNYTSSKSMKFKLI